MAKLTLNPSPTFSAVVDVPVAGGPPVPVSFTFKHMMREPFGKLMDDMKVEGKFTKPEAIMTIATGWELDEPFDSDHVRIFCDAYLAAWRAIFDKYVDELTEGRTKN